MHIFEILDRESTSKSEVYLYEDAGKWYAYEHSATLIKRCCNETIRLSRQIYSFYGLALERIEVDLTRLLSLNWFVALCADNEMMLIKND